MTDRTRALSTNDAEALAQIMRADRVFMAPFYPARPETFFTAEGQRDRIRNNLRHAQAGLAVPRVILDDRGEVVGTASLTAIERGPYQCARVGYQVASAANGHGYATQAVGELVDVAFGPLGLHRIYAAVLTDNAGSLRVLRKSGFDQIGMAPRFYFADGDWRDFLLFHLLGPDTPPADV